jgi:hypothetical protein
MHEAVERPVPAVGLAAGGDGLAHRRAPGSSWRQRHAVLGAAVAAEGISPAQAVARIKQILSE